MRKQGAQNRISHNRNDLTVEIAGVSKLQKLRNDDISIQTTLLGLHSTQSPSVKTPLVWKVESHKMHYMQDKKRRETKADRQYKRRHNITWTNPKGLGCDRNRPASDKGPIGL